MSNFQAALKSAALEDLAPSTVCDRLNRVLRPNMPLHKFVTGFYGVLDTSERSLAFTNAGHNPPLLVRSNGECIRLDAGGSVLGVFDDATYTEGKLKLHSGDRLVLFTDGLTEATNENGEQFGEERLLELLVANIDLGAEDLQEKVFETVREFCNGQFHDDVTLMIVVVE
jgi:sigma-B regulation protein RsbU (phosphoserine phosphatase)